jgi:hypothetical protein
MSITITSSFENEILPIEALGKSGQLTKMSIVKQYQIQNKYKPLVHKDSYVISLKINKIFD